jgi:hypothetical protein
MGLVVFLLGWLFLNFWWGLVALGFYLWLESLDNDD